MWCNLWSAGSWQIELSEQSVQRLHLHWVPLYCIFIIETEIKVWFDNAKLQKKKINNTIFRTFIIHTLYLGGCLLLSSLFENVLIASFFHVTFYHFIPFIIGSLPFILSVTAPTHVFNWSSHTVNFKNDFIFFPSRSCVCVTDQLSLSYTPFLHVVFCGCGDGDFLHRVTA